MKSLARKLRKQSTDAERLLWKHLRNRQLAGCKFRRQHVIQNYIVDFVCLEKKLIIEVDGSQHLEQESYDSKRTKVLEEFGFKVLRFWNNDVLNNTSGVLEEILVNLNAPHPDPLPEGEGVNIPKGKGVGNAKWDEDNNIPSPASGRGPG